MHWCGCLLHDIPLNLMLLLAALPAFPMFIYIKAWAKKKIQALRPTCQHCDKTEEIAGGKADVCFIKGGIVSGPARGRNST